MSEQNDDISINIYSSNDDDEEDIDEFDINMNMSFGELDEFTYPSLSLNIRMTVRSPDDEFLGQMINTISDYFSDYMEQSLTSTLRGMIENTRDDDDNGLTAAIRASENSYKHNERKNVQIFNIDEITSLYDVGLQEDTKCTVCQDDFVKDDKIVKLLCKHTFHRDCIEESIRYKNTCPVCRTTIHVE